MDANTRIAAYTDLAGKAVQLARVAGELEFFKPARKHETIVRLLQDGLVTSYAAGEKQVETDPEYMKYLLDLLDAKRDAGHALALARAAELAAQLAVNHSLGVET